MRFFSQSIKLAFLLTCAWLGLAPSQAHAATTDGALRMEVITAYNFVVDSNIESPAGKSPSAAHLGVKIFNTGPTTLTNVVVNIGELTNPATSTGTPGVFDSRTIPAEQDVGGLYSGTFALQMPGGAPDAVRVIPSLAPGQSVTQYFFVTYPLKDSLGRSVTGSAPVVSDDLWLNYDIWATATEGASTRRVDQRTKVTMRNEISAMANKIWPNGDNKVPDQYLDVIESALGWRPTNGVPRIPGAKITEGIWYDLGNVGAGFDNNGDFIPDRNAWLQPVGDPSQFSPLAARMVKCYGLVIVKLNDGTEQLIPFEDRLYFENLPGNNTGAVGFVYYEFLPLNAAFPSNLTPYQEVASGYDNEKFNADYGTVTGKITTENPTADIEKTGPSTILKGQNANYTIVATNTGTVQFGWPDLGVPVVIEDVIPTGLQYVSGSAATGSNVTNPAGGIYSVFYSTNNGTTWSSTEPVPASSVNRLRWVLTNRALQPGDTATVVFSATVPTGFTGFSFTNTAILKLGTETEIDRDDWPTIVSGNNTIGDFVWRDLDRDGVQDGGAETGIANIGVSLYLDSDNDGVLDSGEPLYASTTTNGSGGYLFSNLPDARYIAVVNSTDSDLPYGYTLKAGVSDRFAIDLDSAGANPSPVNFLTADWPFIAGLEVTKTVSPTVYNEGDLITYDVHLDNHMQTLTLPVPNLYTIYANATAFDKSNAADKVNETRAAGAPNNQFVFIDWNANSDVLVSTGVTPSFTLPGGSSITKVELIVRGYQSTPLSNDQLDIRIGHSDRAIALFQTRTTAQMNALVGVSQDLVIDITSASGVTPGWTAAEINSLSAALVANKTGGGDNGDYNVDSIGFRVTTSNTPFAGSAGPNTISVWPLKDTYDPTKLEYVTASVLPDVTTPAGTLEWFNLGPVNAGARKTITVTFRALAPTDTTVPADGRRDAMIANNFVTTQGVSSGDVPLFQSGLPAGHDDGTVDVTINPAGRIGDFVYWDVNANNTFNTGDIPLQGVIVQLFSGGVYSGRSAITDANGFYLFTGLADGTYEVRITTATTSDLYTLPWTANPVTSTQRGTVATTTTSNTFVAGNSVTLNNSDLITTNDSNFLQDFGFDTNTASIIAGTLFRDWDGDGVQDPGDEPLVGFTVTLTGANSGTAITDANGNYIFTNLTSAGNSTVTVTAPPANHTQTYDFDGVLNNATTVNVVLGNAYLDRDFAYRPTGTLTLGDTLYYDWNGNGTQNVGEGGIANVTVRLYQDENGDGVVNLTDAQVASTVTNASGFYQFTGLATGNYIVEVDTEDPDFPTTYIQTQDFDGLFDDSAKVNLTVSLNTVDFGYQPIGSASIGNLVWLDADNDGIKDTSESGINGVTVQLFRSDQTPGVDTPYLTTTTSGGGLYSFTGLPAGSYRVYIPASNFSTGQSLASYTVSSSTTGTLDNQVDNDDNGIQTAAGAATVSPLIAVSSSESDQTIDFGFSGPASIGDIVFYDLNGNGNLDFNEPGINGVVMELYLDANIDGIEDGGFIATATTATVGGVVGFYEFTGLAPNNYIVKVRTSTLPAGVVQTADPDLDGVPVNNTDGNPDNDGDHADRRITLFSGSNYTGADFGYQPPGAIGDFVWLDLNQDGIQDPGEPGIANVEIRISNGVTTYSVFTDPDGYWSTSVANGNWTVTVLPVNFTSGPLQNRAPTYDADGTGTANVTSLVVAGGIVTTPGGLPQGNLGIDFGYALDGDYGIAGTVVTNDTRMAGTADDIDDFFDDGVDMDAGPLDETELEGIVVYLYSGGTLLGTTTTDADGNYAFNGLPNGTYNVIIGTTTPPLDTATLTTTAANNAAVSSVVDSGTSVNQTVTVSNAFVYDVDFAFVQDVDYDFGDLPLVYSMTTLTQDGARHTIPTGGTTRWLGTNPPDSESNGIYNAQASGDDLVGTDDEDGVTPVAINSWVEGVDGGSVSVVVNGSGWLVGWIDWNNDGDFLEDGEFIVSQAVTAGTTVIAFDIPDDPLEPNDGITGASQSWLSRFRLLPTQPAFPVFSYEGEAIDGEVEDHLFRKTVGGSIGDLVWADTDGNGAVNGSESGIGGVLVELRNTSNVVIAAQTTSNGSQDVDGDGLIDPVGYYRFTNVAAATYNVVIPTPPTGYTPSYDENGIGTPNTTQVVLGSGVQHLTADFGYQPARANLSGQVRYDADSDGNPLDSDVGAVGVRIQLWTDPNGDGNPSDGVQVGETFTDGSGNYIFTNVPTGNYVVVEINPPGTTSTYDVQGANDDRIAVTMVGVNITGRDFLDTTPPVYSVAGTVYDDAAANNNVIDGADAPVSGVTVNLYIDRDGNGLVSAGDTLINTTTTALNGSYLFTGLLAGNYVVEKINPSGSVVNDWDAQGSLTDSQIGVTITNANVSTRDFLIDGYHASVGDFVWIDTNANGQQNGGETGLNGVTVTLFRPGFGPDGIAGNGDDATAVATTTTAGGGAYSFTGLPPGTYEVNFGAMPGYVRTVANQGADATDSDANVTTGLTAGIELSAGETENTIDAGYYQTASIGNYVWVDANDNGIQDPIEVGLNGITVNLNGTDGAGNPVSLSTVTANDGLGNPGYYGFAGLVPGSYTVTFVLPGGHRFSPQSGVITDVNNSDANSVTGQAGPVTLVSGDAVTYVDAGLYIFCPDDWNEWKAQHPGETADGNPDQDNYDNFAEFAFHMPYDSGQTGEHLPQGTGWIIRPNSLNPDILEGVFVRPTGAPLNTVYILQYAATLGNPTTWSELVIPSASLTISTTNNGDCTETVVIQNLQAVTGLPNEGFTRIKAILDDDGGNDETDHISYTEVEGWTATPMGRICQTYNVPYQREALFTGTIAAVTGQQIDLVGNGVDLDNFLSPGVSYYIEVISGDNEGDRFDVTSSSASSFVLTQAEGLHSVSGPYNTRTGALPANLAGDVVVLRRHWTLADIFPVTKLGSANVQTESTDVQFYIGSNPWRIFWLYANGGSPAWVESGDVTLTNRAGVVVAPGQGLVVNNRTAATTLLAYGEVRTNDFIRPLNNSFNLVGGGYPINQSPNGSGGRAMSKANGFYGHTDFKQADSIFSWRLDTNPSGVGWDNTFLLDWPTGSPPALRWVRVGVNLGTSFDSNSFLLRNRAVQVVSKNGISRHVNPAPWAP